MIKDKSKSKLSSSTSKAKIKKTIRLAMGKQTVKQSSQTKPNTKEKRSMSVKAIRYNNQSSVEIGRAYNYSTSKRKQLTRSDQQQSLISKQAKVKKIEMPKHSKINLQYFEWWHQNGFQIETQSKVSQVKGKRSFLKYFAYFDKSINKKKVLVAVEDQILYVGDSSLLIYLINTKQKSIECLNSKTDKINLAQINASQILIIDNLKANDEKIYKQLKFFSQQKSVKSITSGANYNSELQKAIFEEIQIKKQKFFDGLVKKRLQSNNNTQKFYLCLHLQIQQPGSKIASDIMNRIFNQKANKSTNQNSITEKRVNPIFQQKIKLSEKALLKFKK